MTGYAEMAARAREHYGRGFPARDVLRECYGVAFPDEVFALAESPLEEHDPAIELTNQPWSLLADPVPAEPNGADEVEQAVMSKDPDLLPVMFLTDGEARHGDGLLCYRLSELAAGRTTVFGLAGVVYDVPEALPGEVPRVGESLLAVLKEYFGDAFERLEAESNSPENWGVGSVDQSMLDEARLYVEIVEGLARKVIFGLR